MWHFDESIWKNLLYGRGKRPLMSIKKYTATAPRFQSDTQNLAADNLINISTERNFWPIKKIPEPFYLLLVFVCSTGIQISAQSDQICMKNRSGLISPKFVKSNLKTREKKARI